MNVNSLTRLQSRDGASLIARRRTDRNRAGLGQRYQGSLRGKLVTLFCAGVIAIVALSTITACERFDPDAPEGPDAAATRDTPDAAEDTYSEPLALDPRPSPGPAPDPLLDPEPDPELDPESDPVPKTEQ